MVPSSAIDDPSSLSVVCIADEPEWLDALQRVATSPVQALSWSIFVQDPLHYADPAVLAIARVAAEPGGLDHQLGCLCRSFPGGVVVEVARGYSATDETFFAHGFERLRRGGKAKSYVALNDELFRDGADCYGYRLCDYKAVPTWLNARFWAHPERFHL